MLDFAHLQFVMELTHLMRRDNPRPGLATSGFVLASQASRVDGYEEERLLATKFLNAVCYACVCTGHT
jgi:hypothetical protein